MDADKKGICLRCGKPMGRNFRQCVACSKKRRLIKKASRRGKSKNYYIKR